MFRHFASARRLLAAIRADRKAATAVEYGLIVGLIVIAVMIAIVALGGQTQSMWGNIQSKVVTANGG